MPKVWLLGAALQECRVGPRCTGTLSAAQEDLSARPTGQPEPLGEREKQVSKTHQGTKRGWEAQSQSFLDYCTVIENSCPRK